MIRGIILLAFIGWSVFCWNQYVCNIKGFCGKDKTELVSNTIDDNPILFKWSDKEPIKNDELIKAYIDSIEYQDDGNSILEITGSHYVDEENTSEDANLGEARANLISQYFKNIDPNRIKINSSEINSSNPVDKNEKFKALSFQYVPIEGADSYKEENTIKKTVFFPFNSDIPKLNTEDNINFMEIVEDLTASKKTVTIIGHADNYGELDKSYDLGTQRAESLKYMLISLGLPENQIILDSQAETNPINVNDSEFGRSQNRRVELIIQD